MLESNLNRSAAAAGGLFARGGELLQALAAVEAHDLSASFDPAHQAREHPARADLVKPLYALAQQYLPLGQLAGWIRDLDVLEQRSRRLTLHFATQRSSISAENLERLIKCGILQKKQCPTRNGFEERIFLNRQARQVQMVLSA